MSGDKSSGFVPVRTKRVGFQTVPPRYLTLILSAVCACVAGPKVSQAACPPPTQPQGNHCTLSTDVTLSNTLAISSLTRLDCKGHRISPKAAGTKPQVAIFLPKPAGVTVENCRIDGFDFGVLAIHGKSPVKANLIRKNTINARFAAVTLFSVDKTEITDNVLSFTTRGGHGVLVEMDSDGNEISRNRIVPDLDPAVPAGAPKLPGATPGASNPSFTVGAAITVTQIEGGDPTLFNAVVEGKLHQFASTPGPDTSSEFTADNLIKGNVITFAKKPDDGIVMAVPQRTTARDNIITNAQIGIRAGAQLNNVKQFPGTCTLDTTRLCLGDADCNIPGVDVTSKGTCTLPPKTSLSWVSHDTVIWDNTVRGAVGTAPGGQPTGAIVLAADNTTIKGNTIDGSRNGDPPTTIAFALLGKYAVGNTTIEENRVLEVPTVLRMQKVMSGVAATSFGVKVRRNVFQTYTAANGPQPPIILLSDDYDPLFPSAPGVNELSVGRDGNYWGIDACPAFDRTKVKHDNGTLVNQTVDHIRDSHAYRDATLKDQCPP